MAPEVSMEFEGKTVLFAGAGEDSRVGFLALGVGREFPGFVPRDATFDLYVGQLPGLLLLCRTRHVDATVYDGVAILDGPFAGSALVGSVFGGIVGRGTWFFGPESDLDRPGGNMEHVPRADRRSITITRRGSGLHVEGL